TNEDSPRSLVRIETWKHQTKDDNGIRDTASHPPCRPISITEYCSRSIHGGESSHQGTPDGTATRDAAVQSAYAGAGVKSQVPCKSVRHWIASSRSYATASSSFLGGVRVARSCCSWRTVD